MVKHLRVGISSERLRNEQLLIRIHADEPAIERPIVERAPRETVGRVRPALHILGPRHDVTRDQERLLRDEANGADRAVGGHDRPAKEALNEADTSRCFPFRRSGWLGRPFNWCRNRWDWLRGALDGFTRLLHLEGDLFGVGVELLPDATLSRASVRETSDAASTSFFGTMRARHGWAGPRTPW
jgi:hypothetical protein